MRKKTGEVIVDGKGVVVIVDSKSRKSTPLTEEFIEKIRKFEPGVKILQ